MIPNAANTPEHAGFSSVRLRKIDGWMDRWIGPGAR